MLYGTIILEYTFYFNNNVNGIHKFKTFNYFPKLHTRTYYINYITYQLHKREKIEETQ